MLEQRRTSTKNIWQPGRVRSVALVLVAGLIMTMAMTALAQSSSSRGRHTDRPRAHQQRHRQPPLAWVDGVLQQDRIGAWMLSNGTPLQMAPRVVWREEEGGRETSPSSGRTVRLMGQWYGNVFRVRQATLISPQRVIERMQPKPVTEPDEPIREMPQ
jgi:hypothetical protein